MTVAGFTNFGASGAVTSVKIEVASSETVLPSSTKVVKESCASLVWIWNRSDTLFAPVRSTTAFEETLERLGTAIKLGLLPPGTRLPPERDLCEQLGIARSTLRQALTALVQSGHLHAVRGRGGGTFVAESPAVAGPPSAEVLANWRDRCDVRLAVELGVVVLAAERAEPELKGSQQEFWLARLEEEHDQFRAVLDWALGRGADGETAVRLAGALWRFWWMRGHGGEGRRQKRFRHPTINRRRGLRWQSPNEGLAHRRDWKSAAGGPCTCKGARAAT